MNLKQACESLKVDYNNMMEKFAGMEAIYIKFLNKFLEDNTYNELENSWAIIDYEGIEKNAHTLKGVSGNLGLDTLFNVSNEIVQRVRRQEYEEIETLHQELKEEYEKTIEIIKQID